MDATTRAARKWDPTGEDEPVSFFAVVAQDDAVRHPGETLWNFFERSPWTRCVSIRATIDVLVAQIDAAEQPGVLSRLKADDERLVKSTFSELWTFDLLKGAGIGPLRFGAPTASGGSIDILVEPSRVHLEVYRASEGNDDFANDRRLNTAVAALQKIRSPEFWLHVTLDLGATQPSMRPVVRAVERWLGGLDAKAESAKYDSAVAIGHMAAAIDGMPGFTRGGPDWRVRVRAMPRSPGAPTEPSIGSVEGGSIPIETFESMGEAVRAKRRQHRAVADPLVIVLDVTETLVHDDEIAGALYGPTVHDLTGAVPRNYRRRGEGVWPPGVTSPPAAVVVIDDLYMPAPQTARVTVWLPPGGSNPLGPGPWTVRTLDEARPMKIVTR